VSAIVALISIGTGVENAVLRQYKDIGYDVVLLTPQAGVSRRSSGVVADVRQGTKTVGIGEDAGLPNEGVDVEQLQKAVPAIVDVGSIGTWVVPVVAPGVIGRLRVVGPSEALLGGFASLLGGFEVAEGRGFDPASDNEVILGANQPTTIGVGLGGTITLDGRPLVVIGILAPSKGMRGAAGINEGDGAQVIRDLSYTDDSLFVPYERVAAVWTIEPASTMLAIRIRQGVSVFETLDQIDDALAEQGVSMTPISAQVIADQVQRTLGMVRTVLASIAAIALVVGAVGMMNTMYTSVLERRREIGVLKSIGAKDRQVLGLFLIDSGLMGLIGGLLGLAIGVGLSYIGTSFLAKLMFVTSFSPAFTPGLFLGVVSLSFVLGSLAGAWPAWHAARLDPVKALSAE
jgi:putative ABC transport system permease protein